MKETLEKRKERLSKLVQNLFEEAGEVPSTSPSVFGYNCDFSFGPDGNPIGVQKPKNPENRYE